MSHFSNKLLAFAFFSSIFLFFLFSLISTMSTRSFPGVCPDCATGKEVQEQDQGARSASAPTVLPTAPELSPHLPQRPAPLFIPHSSPAAASEPRVHPSLFPPSVKDGVSSEPRGQPTTPFDCLFSSKKATFQEFLLLASFPKPHGPFPASRGRSLLPAPPTARCSAHAHAWGPRARRRLPQPHSLRTAHSHLSCHLHTH